MDAYKDREQDVRITAAEAAIVDLGGADTNFLVEADLADYAKTADVATDISTAISTALINVRELVAVPAAADSTGVKGNYAVDDTSFYICVAADTWMKVAIATWGA